MRATIEYIQAKFDYYNTLCFKGSLPAVPLLTSNARTFLGILRYKRERVPLKGWHYSDFELVISTRLDLPEEVVIDTILHEMIHYYILSNQIQDTSAHGKVFREMMQTINQLYDRHITISHRLSTSESESDQHSRQHLVAVVLLKDGRTGVCVAAHTRLFYLWEKLPKMSQVAQVRWYVTRNPFFNRYRRSQTAKIYLIDNETLQTNLIEALPLVREGDTIRTVRKTQP